MGQHCYFPVKCLQLEIATTDPECLEIQSVFIQKGSSKIMCDKNYYKNPTLGVEKTIDFLCSMPRVIQSQDEVTVEKLKLKSVCGLDQCGQTVDYKQDPNIDVDEQWFLEHFCVLHSPDHSGKAPIAISVTTMCEGEVENMFEFTGRTGVNEADERFSVSIARNFINRIQCRYNLDTNIKKY